MEKPDENRADADEPTAAELKRLRREVSESKKLANTLLEIASLLSTAASVDEIVPAALRMLARAFSVPTVGYFEFDEENKIFLRFWLMNGEVLSADQLLNTEDIGEHVTPKILAQGFTVPDDYLGTPIGTQTQSTVVDHRAGTSQPAFDDWCLRNGWGLELNVPLLTAGRAMGALCLYKADQVAIGYSVEEIATAEAIARQLSLAVESAKLAARLATKEVEIALAQERRLSAEVRVAELARANEAIRTAVKGLVRRDDLDKFLLEMLKTAADAAGAQAGAVALLSDDIKTYRFAASMHANDSFEIGNSRVTSDVPVTTELHAWMERMIQLPEAWAMSPEDALHAVARREVHARHGNQALRHVPMKVGDRLIGWLGLGFASPNPDLGKAYALVQVLADQMAMAVETLRLSRAAEMAAIAQEREHAAREHSAELAKANSALTESLRQLEFESDTEAVPGIVLLQIAQHANAQTCYWFDYDPAANTLNVSLRVLDGMLMDGPVVGEPPLFSTPFSADITDAFRALAEARHDVVLISTDADSPSIWPGMVEWHRSEGRTEALAYVVKVGDRPVGLIGMGFKDRTGMTDTQMQLLHSLSNYLALAVRLTRLAEADKEAALAREREHVAEQRAQELGAINSQLRDNLLILSQGGDYRETLQHILSSALTQLRATGVCIFSLDEESATLQITASVDGVLDSGSTSDLVGRCAEPFPVASLPLWQAFLESPEPHLLDAREDSDAALLRPGAREWHLQHGRPVILAAQMTVANRLFGYLSITFGSELPKQAISVDSIRMAQSLASLAAMTMETARLARRAQDAAIAEDRNQLAQELHDTLAGAFTGIFMQLQAASDLSEDESAKRSACIHRAEELARGGLRQVREFVHTLTVNGEDRWKAVERMRRTVVDGTAGTSTTGGFAVEGKERLLKAAAAHALERLLQEAIGNAQRYASAAAVSVVLRFDAESVTLSIHDDGIGFQPHAVGDTGFGIPGMRTRVARLGGSFTLESGKGNGTAIMVVLPEPYEVA